MAKLPEHSPLGASGSYRWLPAPYGGDCYGSVPLSEGLVDEESDYAVVGTTAHALGELCFLTDSDAWQFIGVVNAKTRIAYDKPMADAVQVYLDSVREWHPDRHQGNFWIERAFHCPELHPLFYGTSDATYHDEAARALHIWDYKNGAGIVVEVEDNPQEMYYACGTLQDLGLWGEVDHIVLHIAQPNGFHWNGPIRQWKTTTAELRAWLHDILLPAMGESEASTELNSGEHCRFCAVRSYNCPQIEKDIDELERLMAMPADELTPKQIARRLDLGEVFKIAKKAAEQTAFVRLNRGIAIPGWKLAKKKANRDWKTGAEAVIKKKFGKKAMTEPELKSPAQIDAMPEGETITARWAFKPDTGLTVVRGEDTRPAVSRDTKALFTDQTKKGKK